jgi:hypothetical protein
MNDVIELPSTSYTLRIGAASRVLAKTGTIQVPLDVPKPSKGSLQLSGLAIGFDGPPREPVVGAKLLEGVVPFQPTPVRTFVVADKLRVFARLFVSTKATPSARVLLTDHAGAVALEQAIAVSATAVDGRSEAALDATVPLASLRAGDYVLTVEARTTSGDTASRAIPITIR